MILCGIIESISKLRDEELNQVVKNILVKADWKLLDRLLYDLEACQKSLSDY